MNDKNTIIAIVLSALVLIGWQFFIGGPQMERQKQEALLQQQQEGQPTPRAPPPPRPPGPSPPPTPGATAPPGSLNVPGTATPAGVQTQTREAVLAASPRIAIDTPRL